MQPELAHVSEKKKLEVENIKDTIRKYDILGILNLQNLPAAQFLKIKHKLRDKVLIKVTKKRLMKIAFNQLEKEKPNILELKNFLNGIPALLFTNDDEFKLQKLLNKNKTTAVAKTGQIANKNIYIKEGPTQFTPGPMIGEFGQLGIKTQVQEGKINIKEDKLIVKENEVITNKVASLLAKLSIEPVEIGLNLISTYKKGNILTKDILNINEQEYINNLIKAYSESLNLAISSCYIEKDTIGILIRRAYLNALSLKTKIPDLEKINLKEEKVSENKVKELKEETKQEEKPEITGEKKEQVKEPEEIKNKEVSTLKEEIKKIKENKEEKVEVKNNNITKDEIKRAADILRELTDKKIRGEI